MYDACLLSVIIINIWSTAELNFEIQFISTVTIELDQFFYFIVGVWKLSLVSEKTYFL